MKSAPRFAFFGTPQLSVFVLEALATHNIFPALVITAPDKPRGRSREVSSPPAALWAREHGIEVLQPATLKDEALVAELANTDWDLFIVAAYAKIIPPSLLAMPKRGCLNIHPSLLPKFRGPSPVLSAILADERQTGVSVMLMDEALDSGPIIAQARVEIAEDEWPLQGSMLSEMLFTEGGNLLVEIMPDWLAGNIEPEPQNETEATLTKKFSDEDARLDVKASLDGAGAREALRIIRAFDAGPRAYFLAHKNSKPLRVIITEAHIENERLALDRVIPEGKREMDFSEFQRSGAEL